MIVAMRRDGAIIFSDLIGKLDMLRVAWHRRHDPWFWTITAREQPPSVYNRGYAASREQAMRYFKARYIGAR